MVKTTPTGTMIPTVPALSAGMAIKRISIRETGATAIFHAREMKTTPSAPKRAGRICAKAGWSTGASSTGESGTKVHTFPS